jgi:hypothetical protein
MLPKDSKRKSNAIGTMFFENLPEVIRPDVAASVLGISKETIYDWHYRQKLKNIPPTLFFKINRLLYLRRDELRKWIVSLNPSLT